MEKHYITEAKAQPHDLDTEKAVLASLMSNNELYKQFSDKLSYNLFYSKKEQELFKCIAGVIEQGGITDINSLFEYSQKNPTESYIDRMDFIEIFQYTSTLTFEQDIDRLNSYSRRRLMWIALQEASQNILDLTLDVDTETVNILGKINQLNVSTDDGIATFTDSLGELREIINGNLLGISSSLKTGFSLFDDYYLLRPNTLTIIAAFTSVGKSTLAMNIAINVAKNGEGVAYYSLEMGKSELAARALSKESGITSGVLLNKKLTELQLNIVDKAIGTIKDLPIYIDERSTVSFDKTIASIRKLKETKNISLAVIDYLQIYSQVSDNTESSLAYMARAAKNIAKELGISVILLSQLSRGKDHPDIKMLRGSGQIEESADNIVLIDRPDAYPDSDISYDGADTEISTVGTAKLILSKGRSVGTGRRIVGFDGNKTMFYEMDLIPMKGGQFVDASEINKNHNQPNEEPEEDYAPF